MRGIANNNGRRPRCRTSSLLQSALSLCLVFAMTAAFSIQGCAPKQKSTAAASDAMTQAVWTWSANSDCSTCHDLEKASMSDANCLAAKHAETACITCHSDESNLAKAHENVETGSAASVTKLKETDVTCSTCLTCHDADSLCEATSALTILTDANGLTVNPHDLPEGHLGEKLTCSSCHKMHTSNNVENTALENCIACHHANVFECGTCH